MNIEEIIPEDAIIIDNEDGLIADTIRYKKQRKQESKEVDNL